MFVCLAKIKINGFLAVGVSKVSCKHRKHETGINQRLRGRRRNSV